MSKESFEKISQKEAKEKIEPIIWVVEDDLDVIESVANFLGALGVRNVRCFSNARQALKAFEKERPSILLTDFDLGEGKNGEELAREIVTQSPKTTIITMSGNDASNEKIKQAVQEIGGNVVIAGKNASAIGQAALRAIREFEEKNRQSK